MNLAWKGVFVMKKTFRILGVFLSVLICLSFAACSGSKTPSESSLPISEYPLTVGGLTVKTPPQNVIVFSENLADVILTCSLESALSGRDASCTQSALSALPAVDESDVNAIKKLDPDLVLFDTKPENFEELALKGVPVMIIEPAKNRAGVEKLYSDVVSIFKGKTTGAAEGAARAQEVLASLDDVTRSLPASSVLSTACYLSDLEGGAASGDSVIGILFEAAGLSNGFQSTADTSLAALKIVDPDYIFCPKGLAASILASPDYAGLRAVSRGSVYELDTSLTSRQGTTLVEAAKAIADAVYNGSNPPGSQTEPSDPSSGESSEPDDSSSAGSDFIDLENGDTGERVTELQARLIELGYLMVDEPSGEFGDLTEAAVISFQYYNDYYATGIVNEATWNGLFASDAVPFPGEEE